MPDPKQTGATEIPAEASALAEKYVRPLAIRYLFVMASIATLVVVDQAVIQPQLVRLNSYAPVINVAGRQRMLSQKLCKEALAIEKERDVTTRRQLQDALGATLDRWSAAHDALLNGSREWNLKPIRSPQIIAALKELKPRFSAMRHAAAALAGKADRSDATQRVRTILENEAQYLAEMERTVGLLEAASQAHVMRLRACGLAAMALVLALLTGVYFIVLQPAVQLIRRQLHQLVASDRCHRALAGLLSEARDNLELRVAQRTSELSEANAALEREMRQREQAERRMQRLSGELAHVSRVAALGQLATGLAHEINQPLAAIVNYSGTCELLLEQALPGNSQARAAVEEMKLAASRAGSIVRRMRNFVRPGEAPRDCVELNDLLREVIELCRPELRQAGVELALDATSAPTPVFVDALQIQQVLVNLIQNAIQAMLACPEKGRRLRVGTSLAGDRVQVDVADSGPGFDGSLEQDPFAPFFTTKADGLGMGLAISRSILEQHQGVIWAENGVARGALVCFRLPLHFSLTNADERPTHCFCS